MSLSSRRRSLTSPWLALPVLGAGVALGLWLVPAVPQASTRLLAALPQALKSPAAPESDQIDYPSWQLASADAASLPMPAEVSAAATPAPQRLPPAQSSRLPDAVQSAFTQAGIVPGAVSVVVQAAGDAAAAPLLAVAPDTPRNPASATKLFTTFAALDTLGPAWRWQTPVWLQGRVQGDTFKGDLVVQGQGDPQLVVERLWLALWPLWQQGVRRIEGDIVLDNQAFRLPQTDPAAFDGEGDRSYNVQPDALLLNYKAVTLAFTPRPLEGVAQVEALPPLAGLAVPPTVPLADGPCGDWQSRVGRQLTASGVAFSGRYPAACGVRQWSLALDPAHFNARALQGLWTAMGGTLTGQVRSGAAPLAPPTWSLDSPPLAEVVRNVNKYSNNVMAQQIFLTMALQQRRAPAPAEPASDPEEAASAASAAALPPALSPLPSVTLDDARASLSGWMQDRLGLAPGSFVIDSGSGLSRHTQLSAVQFTRLLQTAWGSAVMPEFVSSLPLVGVDGTLRKSHATPGSGHLKTGTLRDVKAVAGYVRGRNGRMYTLVALVNGAGAEKAARAFDVLIDWVATQN
ncbi:D-alanyl-D-alanine carboxypeptidase/D-alanyl-D-alanine-endopeptidase [Amphibiibacter pelophylacis]|uniref:D-alanyl-D-alanine carboxypeptidase n=1 Tax=Amphibiibacter pelophylacis TaxID=1799477 RepID=A0ACC6P076_9BURK